MTWKLSWPDTTGDEVFSFGARRLLAVAPADLSVRLSRPLAAAVVINLTEIVGNARLRANCNGRSFWRDERRTRR